jgi:hypothetical protein
MLPQLIRLLMRTTAGITKLKTVGHCLKIVCTQPSLTVHYVLHKVTVLAENRMAFGMDGESYVCSPTIHMLSLLPTQSRKGNYITKLYDVQ